jgi:hypothetical protein
MTREELRQELMQDSQAYCCYCGDAQINFHCCSENHFETFAEMDEKRQKEFLDAEGVYE